MLGANRKLDDVEDLAALVRPEARPVFHALRARPLDSEGSGLLQGNFVIVPDGQTPSIELIDHVEFTDEGPDRRPKQATGILLDRTEQTQLEDARAPDQQLETVGRMAGMIAHDFNSLLTVILSNTELHRPTNWMTSCVTDCTAPRTPRASPRDSASEFWDWPGHGGLTATPLRSTLTLPRRGAR
jgi:signal transduction histidine kinase